jgi:hypothetical protein
VHWLDQSFRSATGTASDFASNISNPVDLKVGADGSLYYLARGSSSVFRVQFLDPVLITEGIRIAGSCSTRRRSFAIRSVDESLQLQHGPSHAVGVVRDEHGSVGGRG